MEFVSQVLLVAVLAFLQSWSGGVLGQAVPCRSGLTEEQTKAMCINSKRTARIMPPLDQQAETCCGKIVPPIKLLPTQGAAILDPQSATAMAEFQKASCAAGGLSYESCVNPPPFYRKYTNFYTTDYRVGIAILAPASVADESLERVAETIDQLFNWTSRAFPNIREYMGKAYVRVMIRSCQETNWLLHPEISMMQLELGGGSRNMPSVGVEESGIPSSCLGQGRLTADFEEFFHTIHDIAIKELDPDAYAAIACIAARDVENGLFFVTGETWPTAPAARIMEALENFENEWVSAVSYEYFVSAIAVWMGLPLGDFKTPKNKVTRADLKEELPDLACLIARYLPDVNDTDGRLCTLKSTFSNQMQCNQFPGSCYCGPMMTEAYLGPAINRSSCMSLQEIKEGSGYRDKSLPGPDGPNYSCKGCRRAGCDTDRGTAPVPTAVPQPGSGTCIPAMSGALMLTGLVLSMFIPIE